MRDFNSHNRVINLGGMQQLLTEGMALSLTCSFLRLILLLNSRGESKRLYNTNLHKNIDDELMRDNIVNIEYRINIKVDTIKETEESQICNDETNLLLLTGIIPTFNI